MNFEKVLISNFLYFFIKAGSEESFTLENGKDDKDPRKRWWLHSFVFLYFVNFNSSLLDEFLMSIIVYLNNPTDFNFSQSTNFIEIQYTSFCQAQLQLPTTT